MNPLGCLLAPGLVAACGLTVLLAASAQSPAAARDLARELATRIAAAVAPLQEIHLAIAEPEADDDAMVRGLATELETELRQRGVRVIAAVPVGAPQPGTEALVRLTCSANLREHVCAAEIDKGKAHEVAIVSRARNGIAGRTGTPVATLDVRPILAGQLPILDVAVIGERLLVLDAEAVALYEQARQPRQANASARLPAPRPWPRDVRGRLQVDGNAFSAFLPGLSCRGTVDPLAVTCAERDQPWPVGIPDATLAAGANYFRSAKTPPFFTAAPVGLDASPGWLIAATDGRLLLVDQSLAIRQTLPAIGDDIASLATTCGPGRQVIGTSSRPDPAAGGVLRAYQLLDRDLVELTPTVSMPGRITALWEAQGAPFVLVVAHNVLADRYEAFQVGISCAR